MTQHFVKVLLEVVGATFLDDVKEGLSVLVIDQPIVKHSRTMIFPITKLHNVLLETTFSLTINTFNCKHFGFHLSYQYFGRNTKEILS